MRAGIGFILVTIFLDAMGFGIVIPVMPHLIGSLTGLDASGAARFGGALAFSFAAAQFFCAPILGALSDRYGRRRVLLGSLLAFSVDYLVMGLAPTIGWLFASRIVAGIAGATYATAAAFVADVSLPEERAKRFGLIGASFGIGFVVGPLIGGLLALIGPRAPFFGAAALAFVNLIYGAFVLPETLPRERRRAFVWSRANPLGTLIDLRTYPVMRLLFAFFPWQLAFFVLPSTWAYFGVVRFGWSPAVIGASLAVSGGLLAVVQGALIGPLVRRLGENRAALLGLTCGALGFAAYAFAPNTAFIFVAMVPWALSGLVSPSFNAILSRAMPANRQGGLQGAIASQMGLAAIVSPLMMTQLFAAYSGANAQPYFPGVSFALASLLAVCSGVLLLAFAPQVRAAVVEA